MSHLTTRTAPVLSDYCVASCRLGVRFFAVLALLGGSTVVFSQDTPVQDEGDVAPAAGDAALSVEQGRLADRFKRLEEVLARLAELSASSDPRRARLLREAISQSREQDINVRFDAIVSLLENERLSAAAQNQTELQKELDSLLNLLLKADRDKELASERDRVRKYLKEVGRLIRMQRGVRARTEGGDEFGGLKQDQQRIATDTGKLGGEIHQTEVDRKPSDEPASKDKEPEGDENTEGGQADDSDGKPSKSGEQSKSNDASKPGKSSEKNASQSSKPQSGSGKSSDKSEPSKSSPSQPGEPQQSQSGQPSQGGESADEQSSQQPTDPADRATQRLRAAAEQMEQAQKKLEEAQRKGAADRQREAVRELEQAKAELERILRQLREEELERTLTQLVARFRKMLESQIVVYEGTLRLNSVPTAERDHDEEIEAARLSRQELQIVQEADKALLLLREEGSSIAFPEAVEQMRDDMRLVAEWLGAAKVGPITQGVEAEIITALEEVIAALEKARKDLEKNRTPPGQPGAAGQPTEPTLVHKLAELKMIRALQMRINQRTKRFGEMIEGEQAETADLLEALRQLAERQERVYKATADLEQGRND